MFVHLLKSKIHRASITQADLNYEGSLTVDEELMERAKLVEYEKIQVVNINNGNRFETYLIKGPRNSGVICLNGAAARLGFKGDIVIIMSFIQINLKEVENHKPVILHVDKNNRVAH